MRACLPAVFAAVVCVFTAGIAAQSIFTVAGGGTDDGRPATLAGLNRPFSVAIDAAGNLYVADLDHARIRKVDAHTGIITTVAGNGIRGFSGDGGPATRASLDQPGGITIDRSGNLFIADRDNHRIRRVDAASGIITTIAGNGEYWKFSGDGGPATAASLYAPFAIAIDAANNLYIADTGNRRIRKIHAANRTISTIAGTGESGSAGDGGPATRATINLQSDRPATFDLTFPPALAVDTSGNVYLADPPENRVRRIAAATGIINTVAGTGARGLAGDGGPATAAVLDSPAGLAFSPGGALHIADGYNRRIRRIAADGTITTIAGGGELQGPLEAEGDGGPATQAYIPGPAGIAFDSAGSLYVSTVFGHKVRRIDGQTGIVTSVAGSGRTTFVDEPGPAISAGLQEPVCLALGSSQDLFISENEGDRVRRVSMSTGEISTVAGTLDRGSDDDGVPATEAELPYPMGIALDASGNLFVASAWDNRIRRINLSSGIVSTYAGNRTIGFSGDGGPATSAAINITSDAPNTVTLGYPSGLAFDRNGDLFFADTFNSRIRRIAAGSGIISTVAGNGTRGYGGDGGQATAASLDRPAGIAFDASGNLFVADTYDARIRRIDQSSKVISTVAGIGGNGSTGDGGPATLARLHLPTSIALDARGNLYVCDKGGSRIRRVDATTGIIRAWAGRATSGSIGDNGPASAAGLSEPEGILLAPNGDMYIADTDGDRVRVVPACVSVTPVLLTSPATGSTGVSRAPRLAWDPVPGAFRYDVYLGTSNPPTTLAEGDVALNGYTAGNLAPITTYYWQIVAKGDPFCSPSSTSKSEIRSFTTTSSCALPGPFVTNP